MTPKQSIILVIGASRGLGAALVQQLAQAGATVVAVARGAKPLNTLVTPLQQQGHTVWPIVADISQPDSATAIVAQAEALAGPIDIVINCASTLGPTPLPWVADLPFGAIDQVFATNVTGPVRLLQRVVGGMVLRQRGEVVHISSNAAVEHYPGWGAYGASKAAMDHLIQTMAAELGQTDIRLWSADPGEMDTAMHAAALPDADPTTLQRPADVAHRLIHRLGQVDSGTRIRLQEMV